MPDTPTAPPADSLAFRRIMGRFATGVCVVSLLQGDDSVGAMTINSFVSVSLDPMLISWSLQNSASHFADFAGAQDFTISILAEDQELLARRYAARGDVAKIAEDFAFLPSGLPVIAGALAYVECTRWALHPAGDHTLILGEVTGFAGDEGAPHSEASNPPPLLFFGGKFGKLAG